MPDSGRGRLTPSKRKFLRAAAILEFAQKKEIFATGQTYGVRILDNNSVLVWTGNIDDTSKGKT